MRVYYIATSVELLKKIFSWYGEGIVQIRWRSVYKWYHSSVHRRRTLDGHRIYQSHFIFCPMLPVSLYYLCFYFFTFSSHSLVFCFILALYFSEFTNHLLCFSFSPSLL